MKKEKEWRKDKNEEEKKIEDMNYKEKEWRQKKNEKWKRMKTWMIGENNEEKIEWKIKIMKNEIAWRQEW